MSDFQYNIGRFSAKHISHDDEGVSVKDALLLINDSPFYQALYKSLKIEEILGDFIAIPGATKLISIVDIESNRYDKFDLHCEYNSLMFEASEDESLVEILFPQTEKHSKPFKATPIYNAQSDFLENSCLMSKYANKLIRKERMDLVLENLESIREIYKEGRDAHFYNYRLLLDKRRDLYYFRASTSTDFYNDYNIGLSVFVALISLHRHMGSTGTKYAVNRCEYSESFIRVYFEKLGERKKTKLGEIKYLIELSNSEIKEGSVRFSGTCAIVYKIGKEEKDLFVPIEGEEIIGDTKDLFVKPRPNNLKYSIDSIRHNYGPEKAVAGFLKIDKKIQANEAKMYADFDALEDASGLWAIRASIVDKVDRLHKETDLGEFKSSLKQAIPEAIQNFHELLRLMNNLDVIASPSVEAKENLRHLFYEALFERRKPNFGQSEEPA